MLLSKSRNNRKKTTTESLLKVKQHVSGISRHQSYRLGDFPDPAVRFRLPLIPNCDPRDFFKFSVKPTSRDRVGTRVCSSPQLGRKRINGSKRKVKLKTRKKKSPAKKIRSKYDRQRPILSLSPAFASPPQTPRSQGSTPTQSPRAAKRGKSKGSSRSIRASLGNFKKSLIKAIWSRRNKRLLC